ncbi:MAG: ureidoglycolate lyase [Xenophilus sp.]
MAAPFLIPIVALTPEAFAPYGWVLGAPPAPGAAVPAFLHPATDFWRTHLFDTGAGGEPEFLWVRYRDNSTDIGTLEVHHLTEQAIVPLTGGILQIVALGAAPGDQPAPEALRAFRVPVGLGICMRLGCWHTTRVDSDEVTCLMATRRSTTVDLIGHLAQGQPARESALARLQARIDDGR